MKYLVIGIWTKSKSIYRILKEKIRKFLSMFSWDCNNKSNNKCTELAQRDFFYISIIFALAIISILTITMGNSVEANNKFSFASTLVSIVLSVIAIIMTIISEYKNERSKNSIDFAVFTLETASNELKGQTNKQIEELHSLNNEITIRLSEINDKLDILQNRFSYFMQSTEIRGIPAGWINNNGERK